MWYVVFLGTKEHLELSLVLQTLPKAQRTQGIEFKTWINFFIWNTFKLISVRKIIQVINSIPWVRCASGNVLYSCIFHALRFWKIQFSPPNSTQTSLEFGNTSILRSVVLERSEQQDSLLDTLHQPRPRIWATGHLTYNKDYPMVG